MSITNNKAISPKKWVFGYAIAILTIMISGTAVYSVDQFSLLRKITLVILLFVLFLECLTNPKRLEKMKTDYIYIAVFAIVFLIISCLNAPSELFGLFMKMALFGLILNYCRAEQNLRVFLNCFFRIIIVLSVIALIFFIVLYLLEIKLPFVTIEGGKYRSYFGLFVDTDLYLTSFGAFYGIRLQSIFWEPGVYAVYLILAIYYYSFYKKRINFGIVFLLIVCLCLTQSTTGLMLGVLIIAAVLVRSIKSSQERWLIALPLIAIALGIAFLFLIAKKNSGSHSFGLRMYDFIRSAEIWMQHFLFGTGYNNVSLFLAEGSYGNSNGLMAWCMTMGFVGLFAILFPFIANCFYYKGDKRLRQIIETLLFLILNATEPLINTPIMVFWVSMEYYLFAERHVSKEYTCQRDRFLWI